MDVDGDKVETATDSRGWGVVLTVKPKHTGVYIVTVINEYDYILIDCPPGISLFAEAALIAADAILAPTIPDYVSRLGLITFRKRALEALKSGDTKAAQTAYNEFSSAADKAAKGNTIHKNTASRLKSRLALKFKAAPAAK
ncbi:MAG: 30S ribosomal protein S20 [Verrucomicrobia bacterium]|nr:30S ribosomal protein S20 [Verrucomicrobiota bacterium]